MPGIHIHLAIAKEYLKRHPEIKNEELFYEGNVAPDFSEDKKKSHYTVPTSKENLIEYLKNKVHIYPFLKKTTLDTDYKKGLFLHLITDKLFFTEFLDKQYLSKNTYSNYINDLYYSYELSNPTIIKHYQLSMEKWNNRIEENIEKMKKIRGIVEKKKTNILNIDDLNQFIEQMASLNLEKEVEKYKNQKGE